MEFHNDLGQDFLFVIFVNDFTNVEGLVSKFFEKIPRLLELQTGRLEPVKVYRGGIDQLQKWE